MGGHKLAAVLLGGGQAKHMVVLVDGAAHGAQGVVTVGQHIGQGELLQAGGPGGLDDAHIGDVVAGHGVHLEPEGVGVAGGVVAGQNAVGHGLGLAGGLVRLGGGAERAVFIDDAMLGNRDHKKSTFFSSSCIGFGI